MTVSPYTQLYTLPLSLNLKKEKMTKEKKKRKKEIYRHILSAYNIADTLNVYPRV